MPADELSMNAADGTSSGSPSAGAFAHGADSPDVLGPIGPAGKPPGGGQSGAGSERDLVDRHWHRNAGAVMAVLFAWFAVSALTIGFARSLNVLVVSGVPFGYYMGAQGALVVFVLLTGGYAARMAFDDRRRDPRVRREEGP